jgi:hypothetical protein
MVIVSIIMGLGVATLLRGTVSSLRAESSTTPGLLHALWVANVLVQHIGLWSIRWAGERREDWPFFVLVAFLAMPILYYAQAEILFPPQGRRVPLTTYFIENRRPFFALLVLSSLAAAIGPYFFYDGVQPTSGSTATYLVGGALNVPFMFIQREHLHTAWALFMLVSQTFLFGTTAVG